MGKDCFSGSSLEGLPAEAAAVKQVAGGMRRVRAYFDLHAVLDVHHSQAWNREVIRPLVVADPACARFIAEGALMRLLCGKRCFDCYAEKRMLRPAG